MTGVAMTIFDGPSFSSASIATCANAAEPPVGYDHDITTPEAADTAPSRTVCARSPSAVQRRDGVVALRHVASDVHRLRFMRSILVCLDSSARAPLVLAAATDLGQRTGARMALLRVVGIPPEMEQVVSVQRGADIVEELTTQAKLELEGLAKDIPDRSIDGLYVHIGTPWDTICREATTLDCDVVVIGSHGYGLLDRLLGTTAAKVVNHCDRSVFVVRPRPGTTT